MSFTTIDPQKQSGSPDPVQSGGPEIRQGKARSFSLRSKLTLAITATAILATVILGVFEYTRFQQTQSFLGSEYEQATIQGAESQIVNILNQQAQNVDQFFSRIDQTLTETTSYTARLLGQEAVFAQGSYWDANQRLAPIAGNAWDNPNEDAASVFLPNHVPFPDERLAAEINSVIYLDMFAPSALQANPNMVALYYIGKDDVTIYYPNIDLANLVPANQQTTNLLFYSIAAPENNPERRSMWTPPYQDPAGNGLMVTNSSPVYDQNGTFRGVIGADVLLATITSRIQDIKVGDSGFAFLIDPEGRLISMPETGYAQWDITPEVVPVNETPQQTLFQNGPQELQGIFQAMVAGGNQLTTVKFQDTDFYIAFAPITTSGYSLGIMVPTSEMNASYIEAQTKVAKENRSLVLEGTGLFLVILTATAVISYIVSRILTQPLELLTSAARKISAGELGQTVVVKSRDEIAQLANTFNLMTAQLRSLIEGLEQRVAATTRNLTLAAEVGRNVSREHNIDKLLKEAVELIRDQFGLYYAQVYLLDPTGRQLVLRAGTGSAGQQLLARRHSLPVDMGSLNGTAATEKQTIIVEDTRTSAIFRPNPLLPETRSEMVVPLLAGERVVGVLDMQSNQPGSLSADNLAAFETLAGQLAIALENAALLTEAQTARAEVEAQSRRLLRSGWEDFLNAIERGERIGYSYDQENISSFTEPVSAEADEHALVASIPVSNEPIGVFRFENDETWSNADEELVDEVAHQLGQQVENLRLLAQADQYRARAEEAVRRLTHEGWETQLAANNQTELGFAYDLNVITALSAAEESELPATTQPLEVMGIKIGEISVAGVDSMSEEVKELLTTVGGQLATRIENLRLFEETERSQVELNKRARQLAAVAEVSTVSSKELDAEAMLTSVVHLTQRQFNLYHAHIFLYDEATEELKIAACGWKEGDEHEGTHGSAVIAISQEQSLVARAARSRQAVIINDVHGDPGWLPNPLLPDTASEMAIPMVTGDRLLGVLDIQSDKINAFSEEDASIQTTLASQVATALQNARSFARAQRQAEREAMLNAISQKIQSATSVEAVLQIAARELGHALGAPRTIAQLSLKDNK